MPNHRETVVLGSLRGVITSMRSIKIEGLRESPQCGLWTVLALLLTSRVSLSVMQVLVDTKPYLCNLLILNHADHAKPCLISCGMPKAHTYIPSDTFGIACSCEFS